LAPPALNSHVLAFDPTKLLHRPPERARRDGLHQLLGARRRTVVQEAYASNPLGLLRPDGKRRDEEAGRHGADERSPVHYSIT
jgi:hypothetical protein